MTMPHSSAAESSLGRDVLYAARYYLQNRWTLLSLAVIVGLHFGGWGWLVAAGLAPIILSALPCLIMCGLGYCMMCRGQERSTASRDAADASTALGVSQTRSASVRAADCCHGGTGEAQPAQPN